MRKMSYVLHQLLLTDGTADMMSVVKQFCMSAFGQIESSFHVRRISLSTSKKRLFNSKMSAHRVEAIF